MQELKATQAREIDKASVTEATPVVVDGALSTDTSKPVMQAGDFYFRTIFALTGPKINPPGFWRRLWCSIMGIPMSKFAGTKAIDSIVMSCPFCGLPIMTSPAQHITSKQPLTITEPIACPYTSLDPAQAHSFLITEGNITAA